MQASGKNKLSDYLKPLRGSYLTIVGFSAVINILLLLPAWYMLQVYDRVLTSYDVNTLIGLSLVVVFLYAIYGLVERYRGLVLVGVSEELDRSLSSKLHALVLQPITRDQQRELGCLNDLNVIKQFLTGQPVLSFLDAPWAVIFLLVIAMLHPILGLAALFSLALLLFLAVINQRVTEGKLGEAQQASTAERRLITNVLEATDSLKVMGMNTALQEKLASTRLAHITSLLTASTRGVDVSSLTKFSRVLIQSVILGLGAYLAIYNEITAGMMIAASILLGRALAPVEGVILSWKQFLDFKKSYRTLDELVRLTTDRAFSVELGRPRGHLKLENVSLQLRDTGRLTLEQINLEIQPGTSLAIIGPSGAGKTSLLKMMCGIHAPKTGRVLLDGSDLAFRNLESLGEYVGYLPQTNELIAGKVSENIARFGEIDSQAVLDSARDSGADDVINELPGGYEFVLGDGGRGLSEGQMKRISLARALYREPVLVFLDEPGAGLDAAALMKLVGAIKNLKARGSSVVYCTHQPNLARLADLVLVVVEGKIRSFGQSDEVLKLVYADNEAE